MRVPIIFRNANIIWLALFLCLWSASVSAAIDNSNILDTVLEKYASAASGWASIIVKHATWLFWTLVVISMVWTFGIMALKRADLGEFFAEFIRFIMFTGFFWWLLTNGPAFANSIINSMRQIGGEATGLGPSLSPSSIVDIGFDILFRVLDESSVWEPVDSLVGIVIAAIILVILALVGINMLLLLASAWILAYGGVFFLGFGGSRWTSDMAINYYKTVLGLGTQLFAMVLLVGIGKTIIEQYYTQMSAGVSLKEMAVMLVVAIVLLVLTNKVPQLISGIITGASVGGAGIGSFGAGMAVGAAGMAAAAAATGGAAIAAGATQAAGGLQAVLAAANKASEGSGGGGAASAVSSMVSGLGGGGESGASSGGEQGGSSPLASAMGGEGGNGESASASGSSSDSDDAGSLSGDDSANSGSSSGTSSSSADTSQPSGSSGSSSQSQPKGMFSHLASGVSQVAKEKANSLKAAAQARIDATVGGQIANAIRNSGNDDSLSAADEISDFVHKNERN